VRAPLPPSRLRQRRGSWITRAGPLRPATTDEDTPEQTNTKAPKAKDPGETPNRVEQGLETCNGLCGRADYAAQSCTPHDAVKPEFGMPSTRLSGSPKPTDVTDTWAGSWSWSI